VVEDQDRGQGRGRAGKYRRDNADHAGDAQQSLPPPGLEPLNA
jgi:hypothetical protein